MLKFYYCSPQVFTVLKDRQNGVWELRGMVAPLDTEAEVASAFPARAANSVQSMTAPAAHCLAPFNNRLTVQGSIHDKMLLVRTSNLFFFFSEAWSHCKSWLPGIHYVD